MMKKHILSWILPGVLVLLAVVVYNGIPGYSFTALCLLGCAGVVTCYRLLAILGRRKARLSRILTRILTGCLILGILAAAVTGAFVVSGSFGMPDRDCPYIIVLGAGVNGSVPSLSLRERINGAYAYLTAHPDTICVVSGGQGSNEDISEAECMRRELTKMGIAQERIWMEDQSTSTRENLRFSLDLIQARTGTRPAEIGLVSSEYHLFRAGLLARDQGALATGIPAQTTWLSLRLNYFLREIVAVWAYLIFGG